MKKLLLCLFAAMMITTPVSATEYLRIPIEVKVTYDASSDTYHYELPEPPHIEGYTFIGWSFEPNAEVE